MKGFINYKIMKKFVLAFCLPVLTAASLIGAGYATWYFDNTQSSDPLTISTIVTNKAKFGKFVYGSENSESKDDAGSARLFLDQARLAPDDGLNVNRHGITWQKSTVTEATLTDDSTADLKLSYKVDDALPTNTKISIEVSFAYSIDFSNYLSINATGWNNDTTNKKYIKTVDITTTGTSSLFETSEIKFDYVSNSVNTSDKYTAMKEAFGTLQFTLTATAKLVKIA